MTTNSRTLGECILNCKDDSTCETNCVSTFKNEYSECPCQVQNEHVLITIEPKPFLSQEKCPLGCPCNNYDCNLPEKKAILALHDSSKSFLIRPNGKLTISTGNTTIIVYDS